MRKSAIPIALAYISFSLSKGLKLAKVALFSTKIRGGSTSEQSYSHSTTLFSPSGRIPQIEYAGKAVSRGALAIGATFKGGVIIASTRKSQSSLIRRVGTAKITTLSNRCCFTYSGLSPDSRVLAAHAHKFCMDYALRYGSEDYLPIRSIVSELASVMQEHTQTNGVRPFGVSLLVADVNLQANGSADPSLFVLDPSGHHSKWHACAIGKGSDEAIEKLSDEYVQDMEENDALRLISSVVYAAIENDTTLVDVEIVVINAKGIIRHPSIAN